MCPCFDSVLMTGAFSFPKRLIACNAISQLITRHGPEICSISMVIIGYAGQDLSVLQINVQPIHVMAYRTMLIEVHLFKDVREIKS
jgi:hypothetical protein